MVANVYFVVLNCEMIDIVGTVKCAVSK